MRDFRDAKAMAHTLRAALATKDHKVTNSESLELIAQAFGVADWNTLSASISEQTARPRNTATTSRQPSTTQRGPALSAHPTDESGPVFSTELSTTLNRALAYANQRKHEWTTLEHLLLALTDDLDASAVMSACKVDLGTLKDHLANYIDNDLKRIAIDDGGETKPTAAFGRVMRCAEGFVLGRGRPAITGAEVLVPIFFETLSPAARLLGEQDMTRQDALNFIIHGIVKRSEDAAT
jgi:Glyoxalase superfamily protein/Clp amino terminal domain, pathogenicity island component